MERIEHFIAQGVPRKIFTPNVALLVWSQSNPFLREVYQSTDLLGVDGMVIYHASRLLGTPLKGSLSASLLFYPILELAQKKGYKLYFVGAKEHIVRTAVENLREKYPGIKIVGYHHGYFDHENPGTLIDDIKRKKPDVLFVGMSSPMKEKFVESNLLRMNVPVSFGVGGMLDISAGKAKFAPNWIRKLCLEWLYRLIQEPRRMWKRYLTTNPVFMWLVFKEFVRRWLIPSRLGARYSGRKAEKACDKESTYREME